MKVAVPKKASQTVDVTPPLAVSVHEAARLLSVSERTIWNLAKQGKIQSKKIGARVVFLLASIQEFLTKKEVSQ